MRAYRIEKTAEGPRGQLVDASLDEIDAGEVVIRTRYSGVNYKDALAGTGTAPIVRRYPCVGGIEAVGEVEHSESAAFNPGDWVIAHGRGLGVDHDGGFAERLRAPADWLVPLPAGLTPREAATLGVAGHSAALAVDRMETLGLTPEGGPVAVTGASGGVGSLSIAMLAQRGFSVTAVTSKADSAPLLLEMGAANVRPPPAEASGKPLDSADWGGAVDAAGGDQLAWLLRTTRKHGVIASIGNAAGNTLNTTVLPFIVRGIAVIGIIADTPPALRRHIWNRLAGDLKPPKLESLAHEIDIDGLPGFMDSMIAGKSRGRTIVSWRDRGGAL